MDIVATLLVIVVTSHVIVSTLLVIVATIQFPPNSQKEIPDSLFHESGIC